MRLLSTISFALVITIVSCKGQTQSSKKEVYNKEFNWRITIPENFDTVPIEQYEEMQSKGANAIDKTYGTKIKNQAKTIFIFKSDQLNYFESNYQPFNSATEGNYLENFRNVNNMLYGTFKAQLPNTQLDSVSSQEKISGLIFQTFKVTIIS